MRTLHGLLFLTALPIWAQPCEVPGEVKTALETARTPGVTASQAAKEVRDRFPQDYFAHRAYQDANMARGVFSAAVQTEYRALRDLHPDDPLYITLYARAMTGAKTPEALSALESALARRPGYAYAHLKMAEIYLAPAFHDDAKLRDHLMAYRQSCPEVLAGYTMVSRIDDTELLKESAALLRPLLERRSDAEALASYNTLWAMEFKVVPLAEQEQVRERVRRDVAKLRAMDLGGNPSLANTLLQGYKMLGDAEGTKWAEANAPSKNSGMGPAMDAITKWQQANMAKMTSSYQGYQALLAKQADEWIRQWPDDPQPRGQKFQALRTQRDAPLEETVKAAEDWLRVYEAHPGNAPAPYDSVAQFFAQRNMRYEELPGLLDKALKALKDPPPPSLSDLYPPSSAQQIFANSSRWSTWNTAASAYVKIKQYDKARDLLTKLDASLLENKPPATVPASQTQPYRIQENQYWETKSQLASAEERKLDALTFQRNAYLTYAFPQPAGMQDFRITAVKNLWKELGGGSDEGFEAFMHPAGGAPKPAAPDPARQPAQPAVAATAGNWTTLDKPLPEFQFSDAAGKVWKLADLKGKVTLINLWATWCGPCRAELPYLQKVYNKVRERQDLQVITFNTDDSVGLILPFMAENKYTFPVVPAVDYIHKLVPELSIPRNWIVDADGVLRSEKIGFGSAGDQWVDDLIATLEKARPAGANGR